MKMKKIICSLMISVLCFMTAISGVSAANTYDTAKLLDATDKGYGATSCTFAFQGRRGAWKAVAYDRRCKRG